MNDHTAEELLREIFMDPTARKNARILAAIDRLHRPDPDTPTACTCGLTARCPTRRELDR